MSASRATAGAPVRGTGTELEEARTALLLRRRAAAARVRRRRLWVADLGLAVALAALGLILTPGLAVVGLCALLVLAVCALWAVVDRLRGSRRRRAAREGAQ